MAVRAGVRRVGIKKYRSEASGAHQLLGTARNQTISKFSLRSMNARAANKVK